MRYFTFCPIYLDQLEAFHAVEEYLEEDTIIHVSKYGDDYHLTEQYIEPGNKPKALPDTHLVRVEPDGQLRIVDSNFT